ncbi:MAG: hypothetical protein HY667_03525 [Chloroflexi bacterium]|nr:hypothetical protein [Chloroflexota bacterium]
MGKGIVAIPGKPLLRFKYPSYLVADRTVPLVPGKILQSFDESRKVSMVEPVCPKCGCRFVGMGYVDKDILYCCEPCATGGECECGCCTFKDPNEENVEKL